MLPRHCHILARNPRGEAYLFDVGAVGFGRWHVALGDTLEPRGGFHLGDIDPRLCFHRGPGRRVRFEKPMAVLAWALGLIRECKAPPTGYEVNVRTNG